MARRGSDIDTKIDALFQRSLAEFTGASNALAQQLKKEGRTVDAERVKALAKPAASVWAVNQLYWRDPKAIARLVALGERVRRAQTGQLKNADLRALIDEKKQMTTALLAKASAIREEAGHAASRETVRRMSATLEALAAWGEMEGVPKAGRLTARILLHPGAQGGGDGALDETHRRAGRGVRSLPRPRSGHDPAVPRGSEVAVTVWRAAATPPSSGRTLSRAGSADEVIRRYRR